MPPVHHVGTTVSDIDRAVEFYTEVFDLEVLIVFIPRDSTVPRQIGREKRCLLSQ